MNETVGGSLSPRLATLVSLHALPRSGEEGSGELCRRDRERRYHLLRDLLPRFRGREVAGESGAVAQLLFDRPLDAVGYALECLAGLAEPGRELGADLACSIGIHLGEVQVWRNPEEHLARGAGLYEAAGPANAIARRLARLALPGQILLSETAYRLARRAAVDEAALTGTEGDLEWLEHGPYRFSDLDEPMEVFEAGVPGKAPLAPPPGRDETFSAHPVRGEARWWPAGGAQVPGRPHWRLESHRGSGGGVERWLGAHVKTGERRLFRFATGPGGRALLAREAERARSLRETADGDVPLARLLDADLQGDPAFLESEWTAGGSLAAPASAARESAPESAPELVAGVAEALAAIHRVSHAHGALHPGEILLPGEAADPANDRRRLRCILLAGPGTGKRGGEEAAPYAAPELSRGGAGTEPSPAADVYACGVLLYGLLRGRLGATPGPFWEREIDDPLLRSDLAACLDPDPEARPTAAELGERLRGLEARRRAAAEAGERRAETRAAAGRGTRRAHRLGLALAVLAGLLAGLVLGAILL